MAKNVKVEEIKKNLSNGVNKYQLLVLLLIDKTSNNYTSNTLSKVSQILYKSKS